MGVACPYNLAERCGLYFLLFFAAVKLLGEKSAWSSGQGKEKDSVKYLTAVTDNTVRDIVVSSHCPQSVLPRPRRI